MARSEGEVVLITGVLGFLGQRVLEYLQKDETVTEIRGLDKSSCDQDQETDAQYCEESRRPKIYKKNLLDVESCREVIKGVDVVLHCAELVSYKFPPAKDALQKNNVVATENLLRLCLEESVRRFVHCSTTDVTLQSWLRGGVVAVVIYCSESKLGVPENGDRLIFGEYAASKLKAEKLVLNANGRTLANGNGVLHTVSLRPTLLYGEEDTRLISRLLKFAKKHGNSLPRLAGKGGKHQVVYVGNAAWAFICAKNTLRENPKSIAGLPINITDHTPILDIVRFCQKLTQPSENQVHPASWKIPVIISYPLGWILEIVTSFDLGFLKNLPISPRTIIAYMGSVILYNRVRASIHLNYDPVYSAEEAMARASSYYCKLMDN